MIFLEVLLEYHNQHVEKQKIITLGWTYLHPYSFTNLLKRFPQLRDHVKLDDFGCNGSFAHVNARKVLQKIFLGLYDLDAHVNMV